MLLVNVAVTGPVVNNVSTRHKKRDITKSTCCEFTDNLRNYMFETTSDNYRKYSVCVHTTM
jgi:hypothetical protein